MGMVDWEGIEGVMRKLPEGGRQQFTKASYGWMRTGQQNKWVTGEETLFPACGEVESVFHMWRCQGEVIKAKGASVRRSGGITRNVWLTRR